MYTDRQIDEAAKELWRKVLDQYSGDKGVAGTVVCYRLLDVVRNLPDRVVVWSHVRELEGFVHGNWEPEDEA